TMVFGTATTNGTLDLAGFSPTAGGLSVAAAVPSGSVASQVITNSSATADSTLTVAGGTSSFGGTINDGAAHTTGRTLASGSLTLSGSNTYAGTTTIAGGTLVVPTLAANLTAQPLGKGASAILLGSATPATLQYTGGAATLGRDVTVNGAGGGTISNTGGALLSLTGTLTKNGNNLTLAGGQISVAGQIVGALPNSDLVIASGATVSLTNAS